MPYILPPPPGFGYADPVEARRMAMLKDTAREADAWMAAQREEQVRMEMLAYQQDQQMRAMQEDTARNERRYLDQLAMTENERIARMSLNRIWEQPTPVDNARYAPFGYTHPPAPVAQVPQPIPVMRASYLTNSPYYLCEPGYVHPGWPRPPTTAVEYQPAMAFNPFDATEYHGYRAPALTPRVISNEQSPFNAYAPANSVLAQPVRALTLNEALATWYAEQVVTALVKPGMFRAGQCGASEEVWGEAGRLKDECERVGSSAPGLVSIWVDNFIQLRQTTTGRDLSREVHDPWNVMWKNETVVSDRLVSFIHDLIQRMSIGPTAVIAAVWYMHGLGLHEGDGAKGVGIRKLLKKMYPSDDEAVERRVALLGLLLAGKWLDDNSFLTKSWTEVTGVPITDIDPLERAALADLHFSLHIPLASWADHVNKRWTELLASPDRADDAYTVMLPLLDEMVTEARSSELWEPASPHPSQTAYYDHIDQRLEELYHAALIEEQGGFIEQTALVDYSSEHGSTPVSQWFSPHQADPEMEVAARNVSALVDDGMDEEYTDEEEDDDEDEFLDYDGATRFLPSMAELRRSASNSSAQSDAVATLERWRRTVRESDSAPEVVPTYCYPALQHVDEQPFAFVAPPPLAIDTAPTPDLTRTMSDPLFADGRRDHSRETSSALRGEPRDPNLRPNTKQRQPASKTPTFSLAPPSGFKETGVYLEPGIACVRPPTGSSIVAPRHPLLPLTISANLPLRIVKSPLNFGVSEAEGGSGSGSGTGGEYSGHKGHHRSHPRSHYPPLVDQYRPTLTGTCSY